MIPWPVAALAVVFAVLTAVAACNLLSFPAGPSQRFWLAGWALLCATTMVGLPLLRRWARTLAVFGLGWLAVMLVATATGLVGAGMGGRGILLTLAAGAVLVIIRYFRRPQVRAWFEDSRQHTADSGQ